MKTVCAWCGKHLRGNESDPVVSHGICQECLDKFNRNELESSIKQEVECVPSK